MPFRAAAIAMGVGSSTGFTLGIDTIYETFCRAAYRLR